MNKLLLFSFLCFMVSCKQEAQTPKKNTSETASETKTTYYFIRHAEKGTSPKNNPPLTKEGEERAQNWATIFAEKNIDLVYTTNLERTKKTALPTAEKLGIELRTYRARNMYSKKFQQETEGKNVLIVGHSDTTPSFINKILGENKYENIDEQIFGNLYTVTIDRTGTKESFLENTD